MIILIQYWFLNGKGGQRFSLEKYIIIIEVALLIDCSFNFILQASCLCPAIWPEEDDGVFLSHGELRRTKWRCLPLMAIDVVLVAKKKFRKLVCFLLLCSSYTILSILLFPDVVCIVSPGYVHGSWFQVSIKKFLNISF